MDKLNHNIKCNVTTCHHHAGQQDYCTLNTIQVGCCNTPKPQDCDCTKCASFCTGGCNC
jgi:hypothetical protein